MRFPESEEAVKAGYSMLLRELDIPWPAPAVVVEDVRQARETYIAKFEVGPGQLVILFDGFCHGDTVYLVHKGAYSRPRKIPLVAGIVPYAAAHELCHCIQYSELGKEEYLRQYKAELERIEQEREEIRTLWKELYHREGLAEAERFIRHTRIADIRFEVEADKFAEMHEQRLRELMEALT